MQGRKAIAVALALSAAAAGTAQAAKLPVYNDPPRYKGVSRAPKAKAPVVKPPPPVALSAAGRYPDVLVDDAGTAHVVWTEDRGDAADVVGYCRLKRGATACDARAELVWEKGYSAGDDPRFNSGYWPRVVRVGDQLVVMQTRYPTGAQRPDGSAGSTNTLQWTSSDGGTTWAGPAIVGFRNLDNLVVMGAGDDVTILNFGIDPFCGQTGDPAAACLQAFRAGQFTSTEAQLGTVSNANYYPSLALDGGLPVAALEDLATNTYVRRWTGAGSVTDAATWTAPAVLPKTDEPYLAGGPKGTFLLAHDDVHGPLVVRKLDTAGPIAAGPPVRVQRGEDLGQAFGRLVQDPSGRLIAAWVARSAVDGNKPGVKVAASATGASFPAPTVLHPDTNAGQVELDAAGDGGGFAGFNATGGVNSEGPIMAGGFGSQRATGLPGLGDLPGGAGVVPQGRQCDVLDFGRFKVDSAAGCFLRGTGASRGVFVTNGEIGLWGLRIVPDAGCRLIIDPRLLRIDTLQGCGARVIVSSPVVGDVVLWHGEIHRDLRNAGPGTPLFEFPAGQGFTANIFGFDVGADIKVRLENDGVHIPVSLRLPASFGGFSGDAELVATRERGLIVDSLRIHLGPIPLGALVIESMDLRYTGATDTWTGSGTLRVPAGGTLDGSASFTSGRFSGASFDYAPPAPITIGPFVYLLKIGGSFETEPDVMIEARAGFGAGVAAAGESPIRVDGRFTMRFPRSGPGSFALGGTVSLFFVQLGDARLRFMTDGYADFGGHAGFALGPLTVDATADGFVDATNGQFGVGIQGDVGLCVDFELEEVCANAGGDTAISNAGFAACAEFLGLSGGLEYPWEEFEPAAFVNPFVAAASIVDHLEFPCSTGDYYRPPPRPRQAGAISVDVQGGLPSKTILVKGSGGAPSVTVSGPGGTFSTAQAGPAGLVLAPRGVAASYVVLKQPKPGTWTIVPDAGSAPVAEVLVSDGYVPAKVSAKVRGAGRRRAIAYSIANLGDDQRVQFLESGAFGTHVLGAVAKRRGVLRFAPADARGGRRTVTALIQHHGITNDSVVVGRYTAPGPLRPGRVRGLRARRKGTTVTVTWRRAPRATRYAVRLRGPGTRLGELVRGRRVRFAGVPRGRVVVDARGLSAKLRPGPVSAARASGPSG